MKGYDVSFELEGCVQEFSRRVILPEKLSFKELEKIIKTVFSFSGESYPEFDLCSKNIEGKSLILIDEFISRPIIYEFDWSSRFVSVDLRDDWRVKITLNKTVDYDKNHPSLISYTGKAIPHQGSGGINGFNTMLLRDYDLAKIDRNSIEEKLCKIKSVKFNAYLLKIRCEKSKKPFWREFLIPEKTTFLELEKIIIIAFDTDAVSFEAEECDLIDEELKRNPKIYSKGHDFSVELKKTIYSDRNYPVLKDYEGGINPFRLWHEYYPDESLRVDESQSRLDDYFR